MAQYKKIDIKTSRAELEGDEEEHKKEGVVQLEEAIYITPNPSSSLITPIEEFEVLLHESESNLNIEPKSQPHIPFWKLCTLTLSILGVQFGWAVQIAFTSPLFLELGVPTYLVSFVWLAGPISGLIMQPLVGAISDQSENKWGRRRPYILFGSIFIVISMILLSNAKEIGLLFSKSKSKSLSIFVAVIGFWILDLSNNTVQGPCRALIVDIVSPAQYSTAASLTTFMLGAGNLAGYFVGSVNLMKYFPFVGTNLRGTFLIGSIVLIICVVSTIVTIKETPFKRNNSNKTEIEMDTITIGDNNISDSVDSEEKDKEKEKSSDGSSGSNNGTPVHSNFVVRIFRGIIKMPRPVQRLCIVTFFTWVGWFTIFLYLTTWVAQNIYKGNPTAEDGSLEKERFEEGVRKGAFGLILNSAVSMATSLALPKLIQLIGLKIIWFVSLLLTAVCLILPVFVTKLAAAYVLIATLGIPWTVILVAPFMVVASSVSESEAGLYLGVCNIFVVLPQLVVSAGIGSVVKFFDGNVAYALLVGGISSIVAAFCVYFVIYKEKEKVDSNSNEKNGNQNYKSVPPMVGAH